MSTDEDSRYLADLRELTPISEQMAKQRLSAYRDRMARLVTEQGTDDVAVEDAFTEARRAQSSRLMRNYVQVAIADGLSNDEALSEAQLFRTHIRAYSGTRAEFQQEVAALIQQANADETSRRQFAGALRSALRRYGLMAFRDGMEDGGYSPESFSPTELDAFKTWLAESSGYVTGIGEELFKQGSTPDAEFRSDLWCNKSLDDIYYRGLMIGAPNKQATWKLGQTEQHCETCAANDGVTLTVRDWSARGMPRSHELACGGWKCDCDLFDANGRRIGAR